MRKRTASGKAHPVGGNHFGVFPWVFVSLRRSFTNENNPNPPKTAYFRRIFICRLYKAKALSHPPHKNPHENHARFGSQIF